MKRLILCAGIALLVHVALLVVDFECLWCRPYKKPEIKFMTMTASISTAKNERAETAKEVKKVKKKVEKPPEVKKKPVAKPVPKKNKKKKPKKKKIEKPVEKKVKKPAEKKVEKTAEQIAPQPELVPGPVPEPVEESREEEIIEDVPEEEPTESDEPEPAEEPEKTSKTQAAVKEAVPLYSSNPPPHYPRAARARGFQGLVVLEVLVRVDGRVGDLKILKSSGYVILDRAAVKSVRKWVFEPGTMDNIKLDMWVKVPVRFQLK